jgi:hypothetical protein
MADGAAVLEEASREAAARLAGMDRQSPRARRGLLAASPAEMGAKSADLRRVHRFNAERIDGLHDRPHTGRSSRLRERQMAAFRVLVLPGPKWRAGSETPG